ncbi:MAG TPA: hypothetical protein VFM55_01055 [Micromonosporaceae bacterium]|nr:hypothetical protein [Micromonosporaceae bacterium]
MKRLQVRRAGPVRLTSAANPCYVVVTCSCPENPFNHPENP